MDLKNFYLFYYFYFLQPIMIHSCSSLFIYFNFLPKETHEVSLSIASRLTPLHSPSTLQTSCAFRNQSNSTLYQATSKDSPPWFSWASSCFLRWFFCSLQESLVNWDFSGRMILELFVQISSSFLSFQLIHYFVNFYYD